ncbi:MAG: hypothetical protein LQ343_007160 [Gyalolechia ehrenbergii]|nr:MAG: hypothetical protein LQ343_007160 [Gyalolechia ehrenbergii]
MQVVWVQHWSYLPVIVEDIGMSDGRQFQGRIPPTQLPPHNVFHQNENDRSLATSKAHNNIPHQPFTASGFAPQTSLKASLVPNMPGQEAAPYGQGREQTAGAFSTSGLAEALPEYMHPQDEVERRPSGSSTTLHQQSPSPFAGQTPMTNPAYGVFAPQYATPYQQAAANAQAFSLSQLNQPSQSPGSNTIHPPYPGHAYYPNQQLQQYLLYPGQYGQGGQSHQGLPAAFAHSYGGGSNPAFGVGPPQHISDVAGIPGRVSQYGGFSAGGPLNYGYGPGATFSRPGVAQGSRGGNVSKPTPGPIPSSPRGPPRKPKQSGHALWVGNLPSGTRIIDLKDHFSREATKTIESVFLISKSNCAFVNYRSDETCAAAMTRFHDSRFHGVRLVCRLRKTTATPGTGIPTGPASLLSTIAPSQSAIESIRQNREVSSRAEAMAQEEGREPGQTLPTGPDKFFIMKSLTVEDMELSVRNNIWATQAHNEEALNKAFETAENVYLIFSANKSGEYFGYARMASPITEEVAATLDWAPKPDTVIDDPELPRAIPTPATEWAPKGHIIDDSARGTIFWEADPLEIDPDFAAESGETDKAEDVDHPDAAEETDEPSGAQAFGKPFKIEWLATNRLPFYRTRGLRNPWNANREVKIARDGTELETSVGRRLLQMFHRTTNEPAPLQSGWPIAR